MLYRRNKKCLQYAINCFAACLCHVGVIIYFAYAAFYNIYLTCFQDCTKAEHRLSCLFFSIITVFYMFWKSKGDRQLCNVYPICLVGSESAEIRL